MEGDEQVIQRRKVAGRKESLHEKRKEHKPRGGVSRGAKQNTFRTICECRQGIRLSPNGQNAVDYEIETERK